MPSCSVVRDKDGVRWLTIKEAMAETEMSRRTIHTWLSDGLRSQMVRGKRWIPEPDLFARLRASLTENPRVLTRFKNRA